MKILGIGLSGVVLEISETECIKIYPTRFSEYSYRQETRPELLRTLKRLDPQQNYFVYARPCKVPMIPDLWEIYGRYMNAIARKGKLVQMKDFKLQVRRAAKFPRMDPLGEVTREDIDHLAEALDLLHGAGWTHRDLHAANVMRGKDGLPRIIDWGEAEKSDDMEPDWNSLDEF